MADLDPELIERAVLWCAEAGRQTTPAHVKVALQALTWDEVLAARALLAAPPPALPLGPFALADIARGAPADVAAERERAGQYGGAMAEASEPARPATPATGRPRQRSKAPFVVRRAADRAPLRDAERPSLPLLDDLLLEEGRAVLSRLVRRHGWNRAPIAEALATGWRRADAQPVTPSDLDRLLAHHGMARAFEIRERDEILHALRAAGGVRATAASRLGIDLTGLDEALDRLGARGDSERLREQRRRELRARGTLTERTHLVLDEAERLADLGLLEEFLQDLRARLPDHVRALGGPTAQRLVDGLCRSLSLDARGVERLGHVTGLRLDAAAPRATGSSGAARRPRPERAGVHGRKPTQRAERPPSGRAPPAGGKSPSQGNRRGPGERPGGGRRPPPKRR